MTRDSGKETPASRIIEGAREALGIARGEQPAASITINGHKYVPASVVAALEADLDAVTTYAAVLEAERDNARNDEWLAAISAVQFMSANWWQDCRSEVERNALQAVTEDVISALRSVGPTEYLDVQWKGAEAAMAAEAKAERLAADLEAVTTYAAVLEAALEQICTDAKRVDVYSNGALLDLVQPFLIDRARAALKGEPLYTQEGNAQ